MPVSDGPPHGSQALPTARFLGPRAAVLQGRLRAVLLTFSHLFALFSHRLTRFLSNRKFRSLIYALLWSN